jgi:hypothetical protein
MSITFENENDVIVYALEKIIAFARNNRYLFVANCVWWIAGVIGLEEGLINHIDNLVAQDRIHDHRAVSAIPRDIAREVSPGLQFADYIPDPLRRTRKGRINPIPQTKRQLKKARKDKQFRERKKLRAPVIANLCKE